MGLTTDPNEPCLKDIKPDGQQCCYLILSEEERAKGFTRPLRQWYRHVGIRPEGPTRPLTDEQRKGPDVGYVCYEPYDPPRGATVGRYWTKEQLESGCDQKTSMPLAIAETAARDPHFYGGTFCCTCGKHFPNEQFVWVPDGEPLGLNAEEAQRWHDEKGAREAAKHAGGGI